MPLNDRMVEVIISKAELIDEPGMPRVLLDLCANAWGWKPILKQWASKEFSEHWSLLRFPTEEILAYTEAGLKRVKEEQRELLMKL